MDKLKKHYNKPREWVCFEEMRIGTGIQLKSKGETVNHRQRIDLWVINCFQSKGLLKIAFEVKVSRSDFLHEINNSDKRQPALMLSNQYYFAAPKGLIKPEEIPPECGLVEIDPDKQNLFWTVKAPMREIEEPTWRFVVSILREAKGEFKHNTLGSKIKGCQHEVRDLKDTVKILRETLDREREKQKSHFNILNLGVEAAANE